MGNKQLIDASTIQGRNVDVIWVTLVIIVTQHINFRFNNHLIPHSVKRMDERTAEDTLALELLEIEAFPAVLEPAPCENVYVIRIVLAAFGCPISR